MAGELHAVVRLLIARMESNPEEFARNKNRWYTITTETLAVCSKEEREAVETAYRPIRLKELHEDMMDELFNGEDRRREDKERERVALQQATLRSQQARALQQQYANPPLTGGLSTVQSQNLPRQLGNQSGTLTGTPQTPATVGSLKLGNQTLDEGILAQLKKAAGI